MILICNVNTLLCMYFNRHINTLNKTHRHIPFLFFTTTIPKSLYSLLILIMMMNYHGSTQTKTMLICSDLKGTNKTIEFLVIFTTKGRSKVVFQGLSKLPASGQRIIKRTRVKETSRSLYFIGQLTQVSIFV